MDDYKNLKKKNILEDIAKTYDSLLKIDGFCGIILVLFYRKIEGTREIHMVVSYVHLFVFPSEKNE